MSYVEWTGEQVRQMVDTEQVFVAYRLARKELDERFAGALSWKAVGGHAYLYRKKSGIWKSVGARSAETEKTYEQFQAGRSRVRERVARLTGRLDAMAPVNRALRIGRMPQVTGRIVRALRAAGLLGRAIEVVGTNALYAYERMAGVRIASESLATADIDLLFDARARLKLVAESVATTGLVGLLRKVDRSFEPTGAGSFRAVNADGYMVDLIQPMPTDRMTRARRGRIGSADDDLSAVEIEGLAWLVNVPRHTTTIIDEKGYPLDIVVPDPRAFALHKAWLARRGDRDPAKRGRDAAQARLVADLVTARLPHLRFDDPALSAMPRALRALSADLVAGPASDEDEDGLTPGW
ncbi:GSU2403 family nucleotidyltransferase fold protein [Methylobacterium oryzisoli]|uniref:GSU2403 family nucleotidyltransferase fold protein n=1 Tax=Methylobacterium oryzisoli TaxID=3385502 RepID=UPI003891FD7B